MFLVLILSVLVAGFIVSRYSPFLYYKLHRYEGQLLYLISAMRGSFCLLFAFVFLDILLRFAGNEKAVFSIAFFQSSPGASGLLVPAEENDFIFMLSMMTAFMALLWVVLSYLRLFIMLSYRHLDLKNSERLKISWLYPLLKHRPLGILFYESYVNKQLIMLSLENRKVYVGIVVSLGEPTETSGIDEEISLTPSISGYRNPKTMEVEFCTDYSKAKSDKTAAASRGDQETYLTVAIKQSLVQSVCKFDEDVFKILNPHP